MSLFRSHIYYIDSCVQNDFVHAVFWTRIHELYKTNSENSLNECIEVQQQNMRSMYKGPIYVWWGAHIRFCANSKMRHIQDDCLKYIFNLTKNVRVSGIQVNSHNNSRRSRRRLVHNSVSIDYFPLIYKTIYNKLVYILHQNYLSSILTKDLSVA